MQLGVCCQVQGKVQRTEAEGGSRGQIMAGLPINHTTAVCCLSAAGDGKQEALHRRVARRDVPFRKLILAAARESRLEGFENRKGETH